ncbi:MAG TPA: thrombospondin type 3 repeat-containing protein, partial [Solirubrobacteraceae bacterium]
MSLLRRAVTLTAVWACLLSAWAGAAGAATFEVEVFSDEADPAGCDADCSLREAIIAANDTPEADTVRLPPGVHQIGTEPGNGGPQTGDFDIAADLSIEPMGGGEVTIDGDDLDRVFDVAPGVELRLRDLRVANGAGAAGVDDGLDGGGIRTAGRVVLTRMLLESNLGRRWGGAVAVTAGGSLEAVNSTFKDNEAGTRGGAISVSRNPGADPDASVKLDQSVVTGNSLRDASGEGGGIHAFASTLVLDASEVSGNTAGVGGGIDVDNVASLTLRNSTVSGNRGTLASFGGVGGVLARGEVTTLIEDSTIARNVAGSGAADYVHNTVASGSTVRTTLRRALFAEGARDGGGAAPACDIQADVTVDSAHSLADDGSCRLGAPTDRPAAAPVLGALGQNGGPTRTHALGAGSAAIDAGGTGCPATDQRGAGFPRPLGAACDIGAFEAPSSGAPDGDGDGFPDVSDNCPSVGNPDQANADGDASGDACEDDDDNDGRADAADNCSLVANPGQENTDGAPDGGDACDADDDGDGVADVADNCALTPNREQEDRNRDGFGDVCQPGVSGTVELDDKPADGALVVLCVFGGQCRQEATDARGRYR